MSRVMERIKKMIETRPHIHMAPVGGWYRNQQDMEPTLHEMLGVCGLFVSMNEPQTVDWNAVTCRKCLAEMPDPSR